MTDAKIRFTRGPLLLFFLLFVSNSLFSAEYEDGRAAYFAEDYQEAARIWRSLASNGHAMAQFGLAQLYLEGLGVEQNAAESTRWFRLAAEQGLASAQFNLGNAYKHGRGVRQDDLAAAAWWRRAAEQDLAAAQFNLAMLYTHGRGVPEDQDKALYWYRRAAANGHLEAGRILDTIATGQPGESLVKAAKPAGAAIRKQLAAGGTFRGEDWILQQDTLHHTIQVIATHHEASLISALGRYELGEPLAYFQFSRRDQRWYAAVYGVFATYSEAQAAIDRLPKELRNNSPWIRQFGAIQALIKTQ